MKIRSREVTLSLAVIGLLSYAACTAEKTEIRNQEARTTPPAKPATKLVDGVFSTDDHLSAVYFDLNRSTLSDGAREIIKANAEWLKTQPPYLVRLVGFADSRGSLKKNERLAQRRANSLMEAYAAMGISKERMSVIARGSEDPACQPVTEECLAKSRRGETLLEDKSLVSR